MEKSFDEKIRELDGKLTSLLGKALLVACLMMVSVGFYFVIPSNIASLIMLFESVCVMYLMVHVERVDNQLDKLIGGK